MANFVLTITGADDLVDPNDLTALSKEYPFVEWAILFSKNTSSVSETSRDRYPCRSWRSDLINATLEVTHPVNLAAHLCGAFVDERLASHDYLMTEVEMFYRRIQFNRFNELNSKQVLGYSAQSTSPIIIPFNGKTGDLIRRIGEANPKVSSRIQVLYDSSGGRGSYSGIIGDKLSKYHLTGYAGGLNEENLGPFLSQLAAKYGEDPFWVDLESGARTQDKFDLDKVKRILEIAKPYAEKNRIQLV